MLAYDAPMRGRAMGDGARRVRGGVAGAWPRRPSGSASCRRARCRAACRSSRRAAGPSAATASPTSRTCRHRGACTSGRAAPCTCRACTSRSTSCGSTAAAGSRRSPRACSPGGSRLLARPVGGGPRGRAAFRRGAGRQEPSAVAAAAASSMRADGPDAVKPHDRDRHDAPDERGTRGPGRTRRASCVIAASPSVTARPKPTWMWSSWSGERQGVGGAVDRHQRDDLVGRVRPCRSRSRWTTWSVMLPGALVAEDRDAVDGGDVDRRAVAVGADVARGGQPAVAALEARDAQAVAGIGEEQQRGQDAPVDPAVGDVGPSARVEVDAVVLEDAPRRAAGSS